jgi:hypothetical protein
MRALKGSIMQIGVEERSIHAAQPTQQVGHFLIANLELEFLVSHSKQRMATLSNRKFIAILKPEK